MEARLSSNLGRIGDALWRLLGGGKSAAEFSDVDRDPWVIEIEDRQGRPPLGERLAEERASPSPDDLFRLRRNFRQEKKRFVQHMFRKNRLIGL